MKETWLQRGGKGLWPDVNTIEGSNAASNCGWWVQLWVWGYGYDNYSYPILFNLYPGNFCISKTPAGQGYSHLVVCFSQLDQECRVSYND